MGDVRRLDRKQAVVVFSGIDLMPNQSGEKNVRSNKSSKLGSPCLRKTLFNVIRVYLRCTLQQKPVFQFLDRKRSEGKPYYVYMTAAANKFRRRYYAKVRDYLIRQPASSGYGFHKFATKSLILLY
ncbi:transposase [Candidatus Agathobaculum pullicola]|uniref:transposase n=1 Tax=Candidatus Agathobaculum pullicola TaxID=2838426 RepID=UPI003F93D51B